MMWRRPWWTYWTARNRATKHLIAQIDGYPLYCLIQTDPETGHNIILNTVEPTGTWTMTSIDAIVTRMYIVQAQPSRGSHSVSAIQSKDVRAATTIRLLRWLVHRASAMGAHLWMSPTRMLRVPFQTLIDAGYWFDEQEQNVPTADLAVTKAVDQLISETPPTGKETLP